MSSRKAEERNEKIIRGLMKLPPNRRCINCNSLGPQYVCTSFWTFVCITCSGIHREFTHRVKSVSMSKFTSQEVEALQKGGNQRARETFLNDWDPQRHKFPDSSNADKVREFIKNVYVDKKFAGGKTSDKPPRGMQDLKSHEDEMRRASSYHSYSQSPPYDYQYEERRYGKQAFAFTRKTGSDRGLKVSSSFSPGRLSHHVYEDILANEGSPTFQRDTGFSSPSSETSRDILSEDVRQHKVNSDTKPNAELVPHSQRTACARSFGSFNSNSMSFKSVNSENAVDAAASEPEHSVETTEHTNLATFLSLPPHSSLSGNSDSFDLFKTPFPSQTVTSSASVPDLFQLPMTSSNLPIDLFQTSSSVSTTNSHQPSQTFPPPSLDLFADMPQQRSVATLNERSSDVVIQKNEGWATFDVPRQHKEPSQGIQNSVPETMPFTAEGSVGNFGQHLFSNTSTQWSAFHDPTAHGPQSSIPDQWHGSLHNIETTLNAGNDQETWNAFANPVGQLPVESIYQQSSEQVAVQNPSLVADQYLVSKAGALSHAGEKKSTNPFDIPYDSALESNNVFLDMSSLQNGLPNAQMPTLIGGVTEPWFPQHSVTPYIPAGSQGALGLLGGPAPGTQITSVPSQGPVAPIGGNPFA